MESNTRIFDEFADRELTDIVRENLYWGDIFYNEEFDLDDIRTAIELDSRPVFLEGLISRLNFLGHNYNLSDTNTILAEIKQRYKDRLGFSCPRTVQEWIKGTTPGVTERRNNYDLCLALDMDLQETAEFFLKHYLTVPFNYKDTTDAIFFYGLYHKKPYSVISGLLDAAKSFQPRESSQTETLQIGRHITEIKNDDEFLEYLSQHCFNNEQQYQVARMSIKELVQKLPFSSTSELHSEIMGFNYQSVKRQKWTKNTELPRRFTESLPTDGVFAKILEGERESYETLRKTLIILKLFTYYPFDSEEGLSEQNIRDRLYDFYDETNLELAECGFAQLYMRHPFDWLIIFCANSPDPIELFRELSSKRYLPPL